MKGKDIPKFKYNFRQKCWILRRLKQNALIPLERNEKYGQTVNFWNVSAFLNLHIFAEKKVLDGNFIWLYL